MVTTRSLAPMNPDSTFSSVVFPEPVPPETIRFRRPAIAACRNVQHRLGPRVAGDEVLGAETIGPESADRHGRAIERQRRDDRVDARAVGKTRVHHRARLVDPAADGADDPLDDLHQVHVVLEHDRRFLELALALDVHLVVAVHEDVGDGLVAQQLFERPEPEQLVDHIGDERLSLEQAERGRVRLLLQHADDEAADFRFCILAAYARQPLEVQPVQQLLVDPGLDLLVFRMTCIDGSCSARRQRGIRNHV